MGIEALSNLLGGIAHYYGSIRVKDKDSEDWIYDSPKELFTATPSRAAF